MSDTQNHGGYNIAQADTLEKLVEKVNALMKHGWMPLGASYYCEGSFGPRGTERRLNGIWLQTMVNNNKD